MLPAACARASRWRCRIREAKPDRSITVFAGADIDATDTAREYFTGYMPSSPSIGFLKNGELVGMFERRDLEGRPPQVIAQALVEALTSIARRPKPRITS